MNEAEEKEFFRLLHNISPVLFTISVLNAKLLKDMEYGEIHITQYVKNGRIFRVEASPKISKLIDS
jgi:hypothetical protein